MWAHFEKRHLTKTNMSMENLARMRTYLLLKTSFQSCTCVAAGDADVVQTLWACSGTVAFGGSRASRGDRKDNR